MQNQELQELQALSGRAGASKQSDNHSSRVVDNLRSQLNNTTSSFKSVLEVRREALQASEARRNLFASSAPPSGVARLARCLARCTISSTTLLQCQQRCFCASHTVSVPVTLLECQPHCFCASHTASMQATRQAMLFQSTLCLNASGGLGHGFHSRCIT